MDQCVYRSLEAVLVFIIVAAEGGDHFGRQARKQFAPLVSTVAILLLEVYVSAKSYCLNPLRSYHLNRGKAKASQYVVRRREVKIEGLIFSQMRKRSTMTPKFSKNNQKEENISR